MRKIWAHRATHGTCGEVGPVIPPFDGVEKEMTTKESGGFPNQGKGNYNGRYANHVGNERAPNTAPVHSQSQSEYPKLMSTYWDKDSLVLCAH